MRSVETSATELESSKANLSALATNLASRLSKLQPVSPAVYANGSERSVSWYIGGPVSSFLLPLEGDNVVLIDTGPDKRAVNIKRQLGRRAVSAVFHTHGHIDHFLGDNALPKGTRIFAHEDELEVMRGEHLSYGLVQSLFDRIQARRQAADLDYQPSTDGMEFSFPSLDLITFDVPGHTPGSQAILTRKRHGRWNIYPGDAGIFKRSGDFAPSPALLNHDNTLAKESLVTLVTKIEDAELKIAPGLSVHPAHSGSGSYAQLLQGLER